MIFTDIVETVSTVIDGAGVLVIGVGIVYATARALAGARTARPGVYRDYRQQLGRTILLGLELLVAGDIIRTVAVSPTLSSIAVLGGIVLIRTFLSFSLEVEITGSWPWQKRADKPAGPT